MTFLQEFKDIPWYEWLYQISNFWIVKSLPKVWSGGHNWKILGATINWAGYYIVTLFKDKKRRIFGVHRLVLSAFEWLDLESSKQCACHKNDVRNDNRLENLFIGTHKDNSQDCIKKWRWIDRRWEKNSWAKFTSVQVKEIRDNYTGSWWEQVKLSLKYWVHKSVIQAMLANKTYS